MIILPQNLRNLGISFRCDGDPNPLYRSAMLAESSGFSGIWLVEVNDIDTLAMASSLVRVTRRIKIATGVVNSNLRLPTLLAMGALTVSELSEDRFILGIGAGSPSMVYQV